MLLMLKCLVIVIGDKRCGRYDNNFIVIGGKRCGRHDDRGIIIVVNGLSTSSLKSIFSSLFDVVVYPTLSEGWGHGGRPWSSRSRATLQGLDQRVAKE